MSIIRCKEAEQTLLDAGYNVVIMEENSSDIDLIMSLEPFNAGTIAIRRKSLCLYCFCY